MPWPECCEKTPRKARNLQQTLSTHSSVSRHSLTSMASSPITRLVQCVCRFWIMKSKDMILGKKNWKIRTRLISFCTVQQKNAKDAVKVFALKLLSKLFFSSNTKLLQMGLFKMRKYKVNFDISSKGHGRILRKDPIQNYFCSNENQHYFLILMIRWALSTACKWLFERMYLWCND